MKLSEVFTEIERLADEQQRPLELVAESALKTYQRWLTLRPAEREWLSTVIEIAANEERSLRDLLSTAKKEQSVGDSSGRETTSLPTERLP